MQRFHHLCRPAGLVQKSRIPVPRQNLFDFFVGSAAAHKYDFQPAVFLPQRFINPFSAAGGQNDVQHDRIGFKIFPAGLFGSLSAVRRPHFAPCRFQDVLGHAPQQGIVVGKQDFADVEKRFKAMGFDRAFPPGTPPETTIAALREILYPEEGPQ